MIRFLALFIGFLSLGIGAQAQSYRLTPVEGINTLNPEIPLFRIADSLFYFGTPQPDIFHEEDWGLKVNYALRKSIRGKDFGIMDSSFFISEKYHAIAYNPADSVTAYFSFKDLKTQVELSNDEGNFETIILDEAIYHVCAGSAPGEFIVSFWSDENRSIDLALLILANSDYQFVPLSMLNTSFNEIFPALHNGDLYFSTDSTRNFDVHIATKKSQWNVHYPLPSPLNTEYDEFSMVFLNAEKGFIASNRSGSDDIWLFQRFEDEKLLDLKGILTVNGTALRNVELSVFNELGELIADVITDDTGNFNLQVLEAEKSYIIKPKFDPRALRSSEMSLYDEEGELVQRIRANQEGYFYFTLLPYREGTPLVALDNPDKTRLLTINIEGQLLDENSNPSSEGEPVFLLDDSGDARDITYTEDKGEFRFENVSPKAEYNIGVPKELKDYAVVMKDTAEDTLKFRKKAEVVYVRLEKDETQELIMPDGEVLEFSKGEALKLRQIDYQFDSWSLNEEAKLSLKELVDIWKLNSKLTVELHSHTDSRGTDEYNLELSRKRAKEAVSYLIRQGIPENALFGKGFGESKLLNGCDDNKECTENEHAFNRRTEVILHLKRD